MRSVTEVSKIAIRGARLDPDPPSSKAYDNARLQGVRNLLLRLVTRGQRDDSRAPLHAAASQMASGGTSADTARQTVRDC